MQIGLYYSDGGPAPATDLVRVNVEGNGSTREAWFAASGTAGPFATAGSHTPRPS